MHGYTIIYHVQIAGPEIENPFSTGVPNIGVSDVPLLWDCPIKGDRAGRHFVCLQSDMLAKAT
jgi:hypothetical protein